MKYTVCYIILYTAYNIGTVERENNDDTYFLPFTVGLNGLFLT